MLQRIFKISVSILILLTLAISLCSCETAQERANREIKEANEAYEDALSDLERTQRELDVVRDLIDLYE